MRERAHGALGVVAIVFAVVAFMLLVMGAVVAVADLANGTLEATLGVALPLIAIGVGAATGSIVAAILPPRQRLPRPTDPR